MIITYLSSNLSTAFASLADFLNSFIPSPKDLANLGICVAPNKKTIITAIKGFLESDLIEFDAVVLTYEEKQAAGVMMKADKTRSRAWLLGFNTMEMKSKCIPDGQNNTADFIHLKVFGTMNHPSSLI